MSTDMAVEEAVPMEHQPADGQDTPQAAQARGDLSSQAVAIMTTEHYNLPTGRAMTVSDANGRASLFLGARTGRKLHPGCSPRIYAASGE
jgi:hypothetical protein